MTPEQNIYDIEGAFETAIQTLFKAGQFVVTIPSTVQTFQQTRPRLDAVFQIGNEKKSYHVFTDGSKRNATWFAQLILEVVTDSGDGVSGDVLIHRAYRANVRNFLAPGLSVLNGVDATGAAYLPFHKLQLANETGTTLEYKWADNVVRSRITFNIEIGIDRAAWAELGLTAIN
jgi:hypothetical protein